MKKVAPEKESEGAESTPSAEQDEGTSESMSDSEKLKTKGRWLTYTIEENPPLHVSFLLGFQQYLTMFGGTIGVPLILAAPMCYADNNNAKAKLICTILFMSGVVTFLQSTFGSRLPIIQGGAFAFLGPTFAILDLPQWKCPPKLTGNMTLNETDIGDSDEVWMSRMREIQGAIIVSSIFQILVGMTGLVGFLLRFIGPLTVAPTISLIGLGLFPVAAKHNGVHWGVAVMTIILVTAFSQYMKDIKIPLFGVTRGKECHVIFYPVFRLFPILFAIIISWAVSAILTATDTLSPDPNLIEHKARTDYNNEVLDEIPWFRVPYPGQWGMPTVSTASVLGMLAGVIAGMLESIGDYYACARISGAPPPPKHAVNRGIGMEGVGCLLAGAWGSGNGSTSYSENIGAIGITRVGSRRVIQCGALIMIVCGVVGKFGALFATIPEPVIGGIFTVLLSIVFSVGVSNLQFVDLNSGRNIFVFGFSVFFAMTVPYWIKSNPGAINTGVLEIDQLLTVILSTNMALGGFMALILDNTIPGTPEERGLLRWNQQFDQDVASGEKVASIHVYDPPLSRRLINRWKWLGRLPFLPDSIEDNSDRDNTGNVETAL